MKYISVCSGIEAATMAWHHMGWTPLAFSEIEPFPSKVLAHHYPSVQNLGDMTKFKEWPDYANVDVLVGGTPCQSFSIAGLRKGLDDPRGNLMLTYLAIDDKYRPTWVVWENVPGVMSSNEGRDFATFLGGLAELGYGFAYMVLDAQYTRTDGYPYAVPQRRRRVFVVGHIGSWQRAAAVLFESESMRGNPPPRREARKEVASRIAFGVAERSEVGHCLRSGASNADKHESTTYIAEPIAGTMIAHGSKSGGWSNSIDHAAAGYMLPVAPTLDAHYGDKMGLDNQHINSGAGLFVYDKPSAIALAGNTIGRQPKNGGNGTGYDESGACYTLTKTDQHAVAFKIRGGCEGGGKGYLGSEETEFTLSTTHDQDLFANMQVRRLTPVECERLQGFPDNFTNIPGASDTTRYKALGNSMAVNVMQAIGERIQLVSEIPCQP